MLNLALICFVLAALAPSEARIAYCDSVKQALSQPRCNFPSVRVPSVNFQYRAFPYFCGKLREITRNVTLKSVSPYLCVCTSVFPKLVSSCLTGNIWYGGKSLALQFWMLNAISNLEMGNSLQQELAMKLKNALGKEFFRNLMNNRDDARIRICDCLPKIKSAYRSLSLYDKRVLGKCVIMTGIRGSGTRAARAALTLADAVNKPKDPTVMNLEAQLCPKKGCCVIQGTYVRNFTVCSRRIIEKNSYGAFVPLPKNVCQRINTTIQTEITTCGGKAGITISKSRTAKFYATDVSCSNLRKTTSSLSLLANLIRNFTAAMCDSSNLLDTSCIKNFIRRIGTFRTIKGRREANITSSDDSEWESSRNATGPETIVRNTGRFIIGQIKAVRGKIRVETTDSSSETSVDYVETNGTTSRLFSRLKKMIVNQRMDLNGGIVESQTNGEIQVDGVFTAKGGVNFTATRLRLVNAAVFRNRLTLKSGSKIQCEGALLLDGTEVDGPKTGDFALNCNKTTATIISGRGKTNIIRVSTKSVKIEVNNGSLTLEANSSVTTLVTTPGGVLKVRQSSTLQVEDSDGDGDLDVERNSELRIVNTMRGKLLLRPGARLVIGKSGSLSSNAAGPDTSTIDTDLNVMNTSKISIEGRQCRALKNLTLEKLAKMVFKMRYGDKLGGNDSEPLVVGGTLRSMMDKNDSIEIDIDRKKYCQLKKRIYLIRMTNNVTLPKRVRVLLSGATASCARRRLQSQECATVIQNGQFIVDCTGATASGSTTTPPNTGGTTASPGTTKATTKKGSDAAHIATKLVFISAILLTSLVV